MNKQREKELKKFMEFELSDTGSFFDYHQWDNVIERDEEMTYEELQEIEKKYKVEVRLVLK